MRTSRSAVALVLASACVAAGSLPVTAQSAKRDAIAELLNAKPSTPLLETAEAPVIDNGAVAARAADPRDGEQDYEQAKRLMVAIDAILKDAAENRVDASKLPSRDEFIIPPIWKETREDRNEKVRNLLDTALSVVTNVPVVDVQKKVETLRKNIADLDDQNTELKEKQLTAPKEATLPGILTDTVGSLDDAIKANDERIAKNRDAIAAAKRQIAEALKAQGVDLESGQVDLLLDSVLSGDLVRLVAVFDAAKKIDGQLARLMATAGDNMNAARKYFAMHAALFAMLVHAQDSTIAKIDTQYMPKLDAIMGDIGAAKKKTAELMRAENRPDQKRALDANRASQKVAEDAAKAYRRYLVQQREQIAKARLKATHDLKIADNTYATVEASVQLRNLMKESSASFEAIQRLEAPSFEQIFKNDELRREFENLTRKLDAPTS